MSRIGMKPITVPSGVTVQVTGDTASAKGPKGELTISIPTGIRVSLEGSQAIVARSGNAIQTKAFHGLVRSLLNNIIIGVSQGFSKRLELIGTGYRVKLQGETAVLSIGFSHTIDYPAPQGIHFQTEGDTALIISGIDKQLVGEVAAKIRILRPPEPYKGKGIRYQGEVVRRKAGKAAKVGSAA